MKFGIDVSEFQTVDYAKAKAAGVTYAIPRAGYGRELSQRDEMWERHYAGFRSAGVPIGAYQYSYTQDLAGARAEAKAMQEWCKGKQFQLPVFLDMEESSVHNQGSVICTAIATEWCKAMAEAGYRVGVYANSYWFSSVLDKAAIRKTGASIWVADWGTQIPDADIWQYGGETNLMRPNTVAGVSGTCDQNYLINDAILKAAATAPKKENKTNGVVTVNLDQISKGAKGAQVKAMQAMIIADGVSCGAAGADGDWGDGTQAGVVAYQRKHGLDADGICGIKTWSMLLKGVRV